MSKNRLSIEDILNASLEEEVVSVEPVPEKESIPVNFEITGETSDGDHTFNELYYHRMVLFAVVTGFNRSQSWKSKQHHDGTMHEGYFIVGVATPKGSFTYHYALEHWDMFDVKELERGEEWDGHESKDITRLFSLIPQPSNPIDPSMDE